MGVNIKGSKYGTKGSNENGQCRYGHPRMCIYYQTRGCKKGDHCDFYHGGERVSSRGPSNSYIKRGQNFNFPRDQNGNRPNHSDARPVMRDFRTGGGHSSQNNSNIDFLDQRMDRIEKLIQNLVQDNNNFGQGFRRWK